jgi:hypothetical protein
MDIRSRKWLQLNPTVSYIDKVGKHLIERNQKMDQQSRSDRGFPVCYLTSQLEQLFEPDEGTYTDIDERICMYTRHQHAICNRIK